MIEYEYCAKYLSEDSTFDKCNADQLNELFNQGWEYVHGFSQSVAVTANSYYTKKGAILIILRRKKEEKISL